jgi:hypothetical protein
VVNPYAVTNLTNEPGCGGPHHTFRAAPPVSHDSDPEGAQIDHHPCLVLEKKVTSQQSAHGPSDEEAKDRLAGPTWVLSKGTVLLKSS